MTTDSRPRILIVDDEAFVCRLVERTLTANGHRCATATSGQEALDTLSLGGFGLIVSDIMMPGMSGLELLARAKESHPGIAAIMLTAVDDQETAIKALELGAYGYVIKPFNPNELLINVVNALRRQELERMRDEYEGRLERDVRERTAEIRRTQEEVMVRLVSAAGYRDEETGAHIRRIGLFARALAERLGWDDAAQGDILLAAPMHDIGKIAIPDHILRKPGKLTPSEFERIKSHTVIGAQIMADSGIALLGMARDIALSHHERWDGTGYPHGLAGEDIPMSARIVAVCDVYDALLHDRVYRPGSSEEEALAIMREGRGRHFDPAVLGAFMEELPQFQRIEREVSDDPAPV